MPIKKRVIRVALLLAAVPPVVLGGAAGAFYLNYRVAGEMHLSELPAAPLQAVRSRILVIAPHCDDETLGVGARIADARQDGTDVRVAFLTNGDGFTVAASRALGEVSVSPTDYVRFAGLRQIEATAALAKLGVAKDHLTFLGYPDRGIKPMWEAHWRVAGTPYRSAYTGHTRVPYERSFHRGALYCGASLLDDLVKVMDAAAPTDLYVTHPGDDHPDHSAAAAFTLAALRRCQREHKPWAARVRLHYYLVHRGDWPIPQGLHPDALLLPPPGFREADTTWSAFSPSAAARTAKAAALNQYVSQMEVCQRFLSSFVRMDELTATLPAAAETARDAQGDDVLRYVNPAADITALSVVPDSTKPDAVRATVTLRGPVAPGVRYTVLLRADGANQGCAVRTLAATAAQTRTQARSVSVVVPRAALGASSDTGIWAEAQTRMAGGHLPIDRTGYRIFTVKRNGAKDGTIPAMLPSPRTETRKPAP